MPVIETGVGNCHVYVDEAADLEKALAVVLNSKTQRLSTCNTAESLLVHAAIADAFLPLVLAALVAAGVTVHGDPRVRGYSDDVVAGDRGGLGHRVPVGGHLGGRGRLAGRRARPHPPVRHRPHRGDRQRVGHRHPAVRRPGRRGRRDGQRVHPVHRRRRVRLRRGDRHQHPEAARPRPDGPARADLARSTSSPATATPADRSASTRLAINGRRGWRSGWCARRRAGRRRCPSRRRCAGSRPAACAAACSSQSSPQVDPAQRGGHRRDVGRGHVAAAGRRGPAGSAPTRRSTAARAAGRRRASRRRGTTARCRPGAAAPTTYRAAARQHAYVVPGRRVVVRVRLDLGDGQPEAGERRSGRAWPPGRRACAHGGASAASDSSSSQVPSGRWRRGEPVQRPIDRRAAQAAEVVELGEPEAGGVDRRRPRRRRTRASRRRRSARLGDALDDVGGGGAPVRR